MRRPRHTWAAFAAVVLVATLSLAWLTRAVLRLDAAQRAAAVAAEREERVRLALWRIDSALALLVADENARSPEAFESFYSPARAWGRNRSPLQAGDVVLASPLLEVPSTNVLLHFEVLSDDRITSPQVPPSALEPLARAWGVDAPTVAAARGRLERLERVLLGTKAGPHLRRQILAAADAAFDPATTHAVPAASPAKDAGPGSTPATKGSYDLSQSDVQARVQNYQSAQQANRYSGKASGQQGAAEALPDRMEASVGRMAPVWASGELFLARRVVAHGGTRTQCVWLDWRALRTSLNVGIGDLIPGADLVPEDGHAADGERRVVSLPLRLVAGEIPATPPPRWTALRLALVASWAGTLAAVLALAVLLRGALDLSERRAEFVSAVTHELRTPLTTFRLYSEMLADDMVRDPDQRRHYLETLRSESGRLGHLVENVLAYARLERGSARNRRERLTLAELITRVLPRLEERARQASMALQVDADPGVAATEVEVDPAAVEQILFNLVDNAAKYASGGPGERVVHLEALRQPGRFALLRVRDHGQGVGADVQGRLFEPFHRSAEKAAGSAPGVGLGLALCRNLSRSLGGDLRQDRSVRDGAAFVLSLPRPA